MPCLYVCVRTYAAVYYSFSSSAWERDFRGSATRVMSNNPWAGGRASGTAFSGRAWERGNNNYSFSGSAWERDFRGSATRVKGQSIMLMLVHIFGYGTQGSSSGMFDINVFFNILQSLYRKIFLSMQLSAFYIILFIYNPSCSLHRKRIFLFVCSQDGSSGNKRKDIIVII